MLEPMTWTLTRQHRREPDVQYWVQLLRQRYAGMKMIVGRDKLDEVQVSIGDYDVFIVFICDCRRASGIRLRPLNAS